MQKFLRFFFYCFVFLTFSNSLISQNTVRVYAWQDLNGNGIRSGEPAIDPGVLLFTADGAGNPVTNTMIMSTFSGTYVEFAMVPNGDYVVLFPNENINGGYYFTSFNEDGANTDGTDMDTDSDANPANNSGNYRYSYRFNLSGGETYEEIGVGYYLPCSIGDFVWEDFNGDGIQNGGDTDLPAGVDITVFNVTDGIPAVDVFGNPIGTVNVPGGTGTYLIDNLPPATYRLTFSEPAGWQRTASGEGGPTTDSDPDENTGETTNIILASGDVVDDIDAGYFMPIDIGDLVWEDVNGNGVQDGEPGVAGVAVDISGTTGSGAPYNDNVNTNGAGNYLFQDVPPGNYTITFSLPNAMWFFTTIDAGADNIDSDADRTNGEVTGIMVMSSDPDIEDIDAGMFEGASVSDFVWEDLNGDGIQDAGEPGVVVEINIYDVATGAIALDSGEPRAPIPAVTSTGAGVYIFEDLWPGDYYLVFDVPAGPEWRRTLLDQGGDATDSDADETTGQTADFNLESGDENEDMDAGYFRIARISDYVWEDEDGNGLQDGGEPALDGIGVELQDDMGGAVTDADGAPVGPTSTAGGGLYEFTNLRPGIYRVLFTDQAPTYFRTIANAAGGPTYAGDVANDSDADEMTGLTFDIELESNTDEEDIDAGYFESGMIEGVVWEDCNGNGIRDGGEALLAGWTVEITTATGGPVTDVFGNPVGPVVTDGSGRYVFPDLPPGDYRIVWTLMGGWDYTDPDYSGGNTDATDVADDSDADNDQSHIIELTSGRDVEGVDAGVFEPIDLSGFVFFDNNQSGVFDAGEFGAGSVIVQIYEVQGGGPCPGTRGAQVDEVQTDAMGEYVFMGLPPGSYIVQISSASLNPPGPLFGYQTTTPTEYCIDLTCDFDPTVEDYDFGFFYDCLGNPTWQQWPSCEIASQNPVICNLNILNEFCGEMFTQNGPGPNPNPLCPGGGAPHNMSWFAFVAGQGSYDIVLTPSNCQPGQGGQLGIQGGIYTDCTFSEAVFCEPGCTTGSLSLPSSSLVPGQTYYFFLDGCAGSFCDYEIDVTGNFAPYVLPFPTALTFDDEGCDPICPGKDIRFEVEGLDLELDYTWSVVDANGNVPPINFPPDWPMTRDNFINLTFPDPGVYTVCMEDATNSCENRGPVCVDITIDIIPDEIFDADPTTPEQDPFIICGNEFPYDAMSADANGNIPTDSNGDGMGWLGGPITYAQANQVVTFEVTDPTCNCTYNQIIRVDSLQVNPPQPLTFYLCADQIPFEYDGNPSFVTTNVDPPILYQLMNTTQANGCDSFILFDAFVFEIIDGGIREVECDPVLMGVVVHFGVSNTNTQFVDHGWRQSIVYTWYDPNNNIISERWVPDVDFDSYAIFRESGTYRLVVTMNLLLPDGTTKFCEFEYLHDFDITDYAPDAPELQLVQTLCPGTGEYTHTVLNANPDWTYTWTYPPTAVLVSGGTPASTITLDWSNSNGGQVTVLANNGCMDGPVTIDEIFIPSPEPAAITATPVVCVGTEATVTVTSTNSGLSDYMWNWGGGTPAAGSGAGRGPHQIEWSTPGIKTVSLVIDLLGCLSNEATAQVEVVAPVSAPAINCSASESEVFFDWIDPVGITGYDFVVVPGGFTGVQNGNMYTVSGVPVNTDVTLTVTFMLSGPCGNVTSSTTCRTQDCTPPTVTLSSPVTSVCLPEEPGIITLDYTTTATGGTPTFSGPGIADPNLPQFDPVLAGVGRHIISYRHTDENGCVSSPRQTTIDVFQTPSAAFTAVPDNICITGAVSVTYTGDDGLGLGTLNYNFDGGTATGPGVGPFNVRYNTPGVKTISLSVERNGCTSLPETQTVTVVPELANVVVECIAQGLDFVEFEWNLDPLASGYAISIDGGAAINQTGNTYRVTGLAENQEVSIVVTALSSNACPDKVSPAVRCTARSCPPVVVTMDAVADICFTPAAGIVNLTAQVNAASIDQSLLSWAGPGIVTGTNQFDPQIAGPGTHAITITYSESGCSETGIGTIKVNRRPVASFTGDNRICITDTYDATVTGSSGNPVTLDWTPDPVSSANNVSQFSFATPGTYDVSLVVDSLGCTSLPFMESVVVEPELSVPSTDSIRCSEFLDRIDFNWGDIDCATSYRIFVNNVLITTGTSTSYSATGLVEGESVDLRVEFISDCECGDIAISKECTARNCPPVQLSITPPQAEYCLEDLTGPIQIQLTITGNDNTGVATWSGSPFINNQGLFDAVAAGAGVHNFEYIYVQENCTFEDVTSITINPTPAMVTGTPVQPPCYDDATGTIEVSANGGTNPLNVLLDNQPVTPGILNVGAGNHTLQVVDAKGCNTETLPFNITIPNEPIIDITGPAIVNTGDTVTYVLPDVFSGFAIDSVVWTINGVPVVCTGNNCLSLTQIPVNVGQIEYTATVYYNDGCSVTARLNTTTQTIIITEVPNIIRPESGNEKLFFVQTNDPSLIVKYIKIYDRWGNLVFHIDESYVAKGNETIGWEGQEFAGRKVIPGVYVYIIETVSLLQGNNPRTEFLTGDITVIR